jgi:outer membrane protein OmpA-like peptidoglycan-associated protein
VRHAGIIGLAAGGALLAATALGVQSQVKQAEGRLESGAAATEKPKAAIADDANAPYCTPAFKELLSRVLHACGLVGAEARRGCQPADVKSLAQISDADFNALFTPLKGRGAVILFDEGSEKLDEGAQKLIEDLWVDRRGARYFFVVARGSKTGTSDVNRALSHKRANSVLFLITDKFKDDPDIDKEVGLLWLGNEFAQLGKDYCDWNVSRDRKKCTEEAINRSAFVSWVDCQL